MPPIKEPGNENQLTFPLPALIPQLVLDAAAIVLAEGASLRAGDDWRASSGAITIGIDLGMVIRAKKEHERKS